MDVLREVSFEDFLQLEGALEWVEGKVVPLAAVDLRHDELTTWLVRVVGEYVEVRELGSVHKEPFVMRAGPELPGRSPDLLFVSRENRERLRSGFLDGPADLVVEVISPGSQARDRGEKFYEYERGGVREYWLVDPIRRQVELYRLDGIYRPVPLQDEALHSAVLPGFWLREEWLWQEPLPKVRSILYELGV